MKQAEVFANSKPKYLGLLYRGHVPDKVSNETAILRASNVQPRFDLRGACEMLELIAGEDFENYRGSLASFLSKTSKEGERPSVCLLVGDWSDKHKKDISELVRKYYGNEQRII